MNLKLNIETHKQASINKKISAETPYEREEMLNSYVYSFYYTLLAEILDQTAEILTASMQEKKKKKKKKNAQIGVNKSKIFSRQIPDPAPPPNL